MASDLKRLLVLALNFKFDPKFLEGPLSMPWKGGCKMDEAAAKKECARLLKLKPATLVKKHITAMEALKERDAKIEHLECGAATQERLLSNSRKCHLDVIKQLDKIVELFPMVQVNRPRDPASAIAYRLKERDDSDREREALIKRLRMSIRQYAADKWGVTEVKGKVEYILGDKNAE